MNSILKKTIDFLFGGIIEDMQYHSNKKTKKNSISKDEIEEGFCPNGCGELKLWDGKLRCWECGLPEK